jgi:hypothetical protein
VITEEDARLWDELGETDDDQKEWDSEDEDSNGGRSLFYICLLTPAFAQLILSSIAFAPPAEDNPANEYPDEDLDLEDEFDDTNAAYRRYRRYASDDEEFDLNQYDEEGYAMPKFGDSDEGDDYEIGY